MPADETILPDEWAAALAERRRGRFFVARRDWESPTLARAILARCVPVRVEMRWSSDSFDVTAYGPDFAPVDEGSLPLDYGLNLSQSWDGKDTRFVGFAVGGLATGGIVEEPLPSAFPWGGCEIEGAHAPATVAALPVVWGDEVNAYGAFMRDNLAAAASGCGLSYEEVVAGQGWPKESADVAAMVRDVKALPPEDRRSAVGLFLLRLYGFTADEHEIAMDGYEETEEGFSVSGVTITRRRADATPLAVALLPSAEIAAPIPDPTLAVPDHPLRPPPPRTLTALGPIPRGAEVVTTGRSHIRAAMPGERGEGTSFHDAAEGERLVERQPRCWRRAAG